jgi:hypothetical protein
MQNFGSKMKSLSLPYKHVVRYKLEEKSKCDIRTKRREALKGPT